MPPSLHPSLLPSLRAFLPPLPPSLLPSRPSLPPSLPPSFPPSLLPAFFPLLCLCFFLPFPLFSLSLSLSFSFSFTQPPATGPGHAGRRQASLRAGPRGAGCAPAPALAPAGVRRGAAGCSTHQASCQGVMQRAAGRRAHRRADMEFELPNLWLHVAQRRAWCTFVRVFAFFIFTLSSCIFSAKSAIDFVIFVFSGQHPQKITNNKTVLFQALFFGYFLASIFWHRHLGHCFLVFRLGSSRKKSGKKGT